MGSEVAVLQFTIVKSPFSAVAVTAVLEKASMVLTNPNDIACQKTVYHASDQPGNESNGSLGPIGCRRVC